jgi:hypothetical protein
MSHPPRDRSEFWIRFTFAFLFFGFLVALVIIRFLDSMEMAQGVGIWAVVSISISIYAAKVGDDAWHRLIDALRWW